MYKLVDEVVTNYWYQNLRNNMVSPPKKTHQSFVVGTLLALIIIPSKMSVCMWLLEALNLCVLPRNCTWHTLSAIYQPSGQDAIVFMHIKNVFASSRNSPTPKPITHIGTNARVFVVDHKALLLIQKLQHKSRLGHPTMLSVHKMNGNCGGICHFHDTQV